MEKKEFKGKAIYNPKGKAGEYSKWACNFYVGCSNGCTYCYLKKGRGAKVLGSNVPELKKCFESEDHAIDIFIKELRKNENDIKKHGLFFSFTTDPMIEETWQLTYKAVKICNSMDIPVKILTKEVGWLYKLDKINGERINNTLIAIGMTLTGVDILEPNASLNTTRVQALSMAKRNGFKTFASIEPIITFDDTKRMIKASMSIVDLFKIGLESGQRYKRDEIKDFVLWLEKNVKTKIFLKESITKGTINVIYGNFVDKYYNLFNS